MPPIGSWLLNYTAMEDEDLTKEQKLALENWEKSEGGKEPEEQHWVRDCPCFSAIVMGEKHDVWKGHICTSDLAKFASPVVRALLLKGHAYKLEQSAESLMTEVLAGLEGYVAYKAKHLKLNALDFQP